jgi:hypothetical protein
MSNLITKHILNELAAASEKTIVAYKGNKKELMTNFTVERSDLFASIESAALSGDIKLTTEGIQLLKKQWNGYITVQLNKHNLDMRARKSA